MQMVLILTGAIVGAATAIAAQLVNDQFSRTREHQARVRATAAALLAAGRTLQQMVYVRRTTGEIQHEHASMATERWVAAWYELKWIGPRGLVASARTFVESGGALLRDWDADQPSRFLDEDMSDAGNAFEAAVDAWNAGSRPRNAR